MQTVLFWIGGILTISGFLMIAFELTKLGNNKRGRIVVTIVMLLASVWWGVLLVRGVRGTGYLFGTCLLIALLHGLMALNFPQPQ